MQHSLLKDAVETAKVPARKTQEAGINNAWQRLYVAACCALLLTLFSHTAFGDHYFRGGHAAYTYEGNGKYTLTIVSYWHKDQVKFISQRFDIRPKMDPPVTVSKTLLPDGETVQHIQKQTVVWSAPGTFKSYWGICCWEEVNNFPNGIQGFSFAVNYNPENASSSPRFLDLPYFNFKAGEPINYKMGVEDPDGHEQEFSLVAPYYGTEDVYEQMLASGFQINPDGYIQWDNPLPGRWLATVRVSEKINGVLTGAYTSWEIIINVSDTTNSNQAPTFSTLEPKAVKAGETLSFQIEALDAAGQDVTLSAYGASFEKGATFTQTTSGNLAKGIYSWTPPQSTKGTYQVQFIAAGKKDPALISQLNVTITVAECSEFTTAYTILASPCSGSNSGNIRLDAPEAGFSPYQYSLDNGLSYQIAADFENLAPGTYNGIVRDAIGCMSNVIAITLEEAPLPEVTLSLPATVCVDAGAVALNGGSPAGGVYQGTGVENGFFYPEKAGAGTHSIQYTYTNSNSCSNTASAELTVNEALTADAGADTVVYTNSGRGDVNGGSIGYGAGNGSEKGQGAENGVGSDRGCATLTGEATGGTAPYTYRWSTGETAQSITVCPGETTTYLLTVTDAVGCTATSQTQVVAEDIQNDTDANPSGNSTASADTKAKISAYPNPLTETSQLKINLPEADQITVEITDMSGNVVKKLYTGPISAKQTLSFPLNSKLGNGKVYIARVKGAKGVHHCRLTLK